MLSKNFLYGGFIMNIASNTVDNIMSVTFLCDIAWRLQSRWKQHSDSDL
jgi:hypothetical protein